MFFVRFSRCCWSSFDLPFWNRLKMNEQKNDLYSPFSAGNQSFVSSSLGTFLMNILRIFIAFLTEKNATRKFIFRAKKELYVISTAAAGQNPRIKNRSKHTPCVGHLTTTQQDNKHPKNNPFDDHIFCRKKATKLLNSNVDYVHSSNTELICFFEAEEEPLPKTRISI